MLFNSLHFALFFPLVTLLYFYLPQNKRWALLLFASCYFYMVFIPIYILILFFTIIIDYFAGILIENASGRKRKLYLSWSIIANVGVLAIFKYFDFFVTNINAVGEALHLHYPIHLLGIILPVGLSFHTFQAMSYTIEVYRGNQKAERHFGIYSLYVMYYPQLVAGPIERPQNIIHQFKEKHNFNYKRVKSGLMLMAWGLIKKIVIADRLSIFVDRAYSNLDGYENVGLIIAAIFFSFQIYCDFSGYSDIAIGASRVMGIELMTNFRQPYFSQSISEFWKRWHISLSTWFRDYLYIPLGGNRVKTLGRAYLNIFLVFLISGFWHGAQWTFIVWGALHGLYLLSALIRDRIFGMRKKNKNRVRNILNVIFTFLLVTLAWVFFRAPNFETAQLIFSKMFEGWGSLISNVLSGNIPYDNLSLGLGKAPLFTAVGVIIFLLAFDKLHSKINMNKWISKQALPLRYSVYIGAVFAIYFLGSFKTDSSFIYFQF